jgi:hypothetical protein
VQWHDAEGNRLDMFPAELVRLDTVDRNYGRG